MAEEQLLTGGIISEQEKETDYMKEYMMSTVLSIKEDLLMNFPEETSEFYVYTRYSEKNGFLKIFVSLLKNTKINYREININFLITLNKEFPSNPPKVFCLTDVNYIYFILFYILVC